MANDVGAPVGAEMAELFLTSDELAELTGYVRASDQCRWLDAEGWKFVRNAARRPIVSRAHAEARLGGAAVEDARLVKPDWDALKRTMSDGAAARKGP